MSDERAQLWIDTYRSNDVGAEAPLFVGKPPIQEYLLDMSDRPFLDFTAGGGAMPLGQGNGYIAHRLQLATGSVFHSGPLGVHVHAAQMDLVGRLTPYFGEGSRVLLRASETEAFLALHSVIPERETGQVIAVINRQRPILASTYGDVGFWNYAHPSSLVTAVSYGSIKAFLICPLDPDTHEAVSAEWLQVVVDLSRKSGIPIVWDETVSGMGWTQEMFSIPEYAHYAVLGGGLGGGFPLGAIVAREGSSLRFDEIDDNSNLFAGNALICSAGVATLDALTMNMQKGGVAYPIVERLDDELLHLQKLFSDRIVGLDGESLKRGVRFKDSALAEAVRNQCAVDGLLVGWSTYSGNVVTVTASLANTLQDVEEMAGILQAALMKVTESDDG